MDEDAVMGLRLCMCPGFALTEDTGDILVVGLQAGFHDLWTDGLEGTNKTGADPSGCPPGTPL